MTKSKLLFFFIFLIVLSVTVSAVEYISRGPQGPVTKTEGRYGIELTPTTNLLTNPVLWLAIILAIFYVKYFKKEPVYIIGGVALAAITLYLLFIPTNTKIEIPNEIKTDWQGDYQIKMAENLIPEEYTAETSYYDYSSTTVKKLSQQIAADSNNELDAVQKTLDWVYSNVFYVYNEPDDKCFKGTASGVITSKEGQCDTMTIATIGILRGMGIAARPVGGCVWKKDFCLEYTQAVFGEDQQNNPRYHELNLTLIEQMIQSRSGEELFFSRGYDVFVSRAGGLHAYLEVWDPDKGWLTADATSGEIVINSCWNYDVELRPTNEDKLHICVSTSPTYAQWCAKQG